jgi:nucleoid DNA-binding protein
MENIISHIENLLLQNDYVIVPELGGFTIRQKSAEIRAGEIIPPFSTVSFNARMSHSDGLLATELMRSENIGYREANKLIEVEVDKIKAKFQKENELNIGKLGILFLNEDKKIVFRASKETDFIPANFGLKPLYIAKRKTENDHRKVTITLPRNRDIFRYAAAVLVLIGIFLFSPKTGDSNLSNYAGWNNPLTMLNSTIDTKSEEIEILTEIFIEQEIIEVQELPKIYHIIVACLASRNSAERFREQLLTKQFENAHILPARTTNRIVIESFSDEETAILYMRELRKMNREFKDAWLHRESSEL